MKESRGLTPQEIGLLKHLAQIERDKAQRRKRGRLALVSPVPALMFVSPAYIAQMQRALERYADSDGDGDGDESAEII